MIFKPLLDDFERSYADWLADPDDWDDEPNRDNYMPGGDWFQLFETVSEGTPLSPPFATREELAAWLTNNVDYWGKRRTPEQAAAIVRVGYSPSGLWANGTFYNAEEAVTVLNAGNRIS